MQLDAPGHGEVARDQPGKRREREPQARPAHLERHAPQAERTARRGRDEDAAEPAVGPRAQRRLAPEAARGLAQNLGGHLPHQLTLAGDIVQE